VFEAADIREWRGHNVVDADGHKIGELEAVYVDTGTDLPSFGTVRVGLPNPAPARVRALDRATVGPGTSRSRAAKGSEGCPVDRYRRRAARGRRRGNLQALRPDLRAGRRRLARR
jgi:hypothetical protein